MNELLERAHHALNADCLHSPGLFREIITSLLAEIERLDRRLNTPELLDFADGIVREAAHQRERWASDHDGGKTPTDWYWLVGHLAGRALWHASEVEKLTRLSRPLPEIGQVVDRHREKAVHHIITTGAAIANWHAAVLGLTNMRPGLDPRTLAAESLQSTTGESL